MRTKKEPQEQLSASSVIITNNITSYMDKVWLGLLFSLIYVFFTEALLFLLIKFSKLDVSKDFLFLPGRWNPDFSYILRNIILTNSLSWFFYILFKLIYKKASFEVKKVCICVIYLICATIYSFGHWGFNYLSIFYCIPVILSCPLGKNSHISVFIASIILQIIYCIFQYLLIPSLFNILVAALSLAFLIAVYLITIFIYKTLMTALADVKAYEKLNTDLKLRLFHDNLTGAYSKSALMNESNSITSYAAVGFIDLDNFKEINDTYGHDIGDEILKALVSTFQSHGEAVFRYGGDEFIILSHLFKNDFMEKLKRIKSEFISRCEKDYHLTATFSAGVVEIKSNTDLKQLLKDSDRIMYNAKHSGKNTVATE